MAKAGVKKSEEHKQAISDGVARARRKPVAGWPVPGAPKEACILWSDGELEVRTVPPHPAEAALNRLFRESRKAQQ